MGDAMHSAVRLAMALALLALAYNTYEVGQAVVRFAASERAPAAQLPLVHVGAWAASHRAGTRGARAEEQGLRDIAPHSAQRAEGLPRTGGSGGGLDALVEADPRRRADGGGEGRGRVAVDTEAARLPVADHIPDVPETGGGVAPGEWNGAVGDAQRTVSASASGRGRAGGAYYSGETESDGPLPADTEAVDGREWMRVPPASLRKVYVGNTWGGQSNQKECMVNLLWRAINDSADGVVVNHCKMHLSWHARPLEQYVPPWNRAAATADCFSLWDFVTLGDHLWRAHRIVLLRDESGVGVRKRWRQQEICHPYSTCPRSPDCCGAIPLCHALSLAFTPHAAIAEYVQRVRDHLARVAAARGDDGFVAYHVRTYGVEEADVEWRIHGTLQALFAQPAGRRLVARSRVLYLCSELSGDEEFRRRLAAYGNFTVVAKEDADPAIADVPFQVASIIDMHVSTEAAEFVAFTHKLSSFADYIEQIRMDHWPRSTTHRFLWNADRAVPPESLVFP